MKTGGHEGIYISTEPLWEETSGFLKFLSNVPKEVKKLENALSFGLRVVDAPPKSIDGEEAVIARTAFVVVRKNRLMPERLYCLVAVLHKHSLHAFTGVYTPSGDILTIRQLKPVEDFHKGLPVLRDWLKHLITTSCEKPA